MHLINFLFFPKISLAIINALLLANKRLLCVVPSERPKNLCQISPEGQALFSHEFENFNCSGPQYCPFFCRFHLFFLLTWCNLFTSFRFYNLPSFVSMFISPSELPAFLRRWWTPAVSSLGPVGWGRARGAAGSLKAQGLGQGSLLPGLGGAVCPDWMWMRNDKIIWCSVTFPKEPPFAVAHWFLWYCFLRLLWVF